MRRVAQESTSPGRHCCCCPTGRPRGAPTRIALVTAQRRRVRCCRRRRPPPRSSTGVAPVRPRQTRPSERRGGGQGLLSGGSGQVRRVGRPPSAAPDLAITRDEYARQVKTRGGWKAGVFGAMEGLGLAGSWSSGGWRRVGGILMPTTGRLLKVKSCRVHVHAAPRAKARHSAKCARRARRVAAAPAAAADQPAACADCCDRSDRDDALLGEEAAGQLETHEESPKKGQRRPARRS